MHQILVVSTNVDIYDCIVPVYQVQLCQGRQGCLFCVHCSCSHCFPHREVTPAFRNPWYMTVAILLAKQELCVCWDRTLSSHFHFRSSQVQSIPFHSIQIFVPVWHDASVCSRRTRFDRSPWQSREGRVFSLGVQVLENDDTDQENWHRVQHLDKYDCIPYPMSQGKTKLFCCWNSGPSVSLHSSTTLTPKTIYMDQPPPYYNHTTRMVLVRQYPSGKSTTLPMSPIMENDMLLLLPVSGIMSAWITPILANPFTTTTNPLCFVIGAVSYDWERNSILLGEWSDALSHDNHGPFFPVRSCWEARMIEYSRRIRHRQALSLLVSSRMILGKPR